MREAVSAAYPSKSWAEKVRNWPEDQVIAVYFRLKAQNKLGVVR